MLEITKIKRHGNEVRCHGKEKGVNAVSFDMAVSLPDLEVKRLNIEPCMATGMALGKISDLVEEYGADNLPERVLLAWG